MFKLEDVEWKSTRHAICSTMKRTSQLQPMNDLLLADSVSQTWTQIRLKPPPTPPIWWRPRSTRRLSEIVNLFTFLFNIEFSTIMYNIWFNSTRIGTFDDHFKFSKESYFYWSFEAKFCKQLLWCLVVKSIEIEKQQNSYRAALMASFKNRPTRFLNSS